MKLIRPCMIVSLFCAVALCICVPDLKAGPIPSHLVATLTQQKQSLQKPKATAHSTTLNWTQATIPANDICSGGGAAVVISNNVYRSTTQMTWTTVPAGTTPYASISPAATQYVDTGVTAGATEFYIVTAVSCGGESGASNEVSATTPTNALPPNPPSNLTGSPQ